MNELALLQGQEAASWEESSLDGAPDALLSLMPLPKCAACRAARRNRLIHSDLGRRLRLMFLCSV